MNKIKLKDISKNDFKNIYNITSQETVMKFVGNRLLWDKSKVKRFIKYNLEEQKLTDLCRQNYYYKIVNENSISYKFIGIIGFHTFQNFKGYYLTVYLDPKEHAKGYFTKSLKQLFKKVKKHKPNLKYIFSLVNINNYNMIEISNYKFKFIKKFKIKDNIYNQYKIFI